MKQGRLSEAKIVSSLREAEKGKMPGRPDNKGAKLYIAYYCNERRHPDKYTHSCTGPAYQAN